VLAEALAERRSSVLVDLSDCNFIDSTGLSVLVETKRRLAEEERRFGVCCPDADVRRLLELTGIDRAVGLFDTREEAVEALNNSHG
jgi:anti-anti-sigma factor